MPRVTIERNKVGLPTTTAQPRAGSLPAGGLSVLGRRLEGAGERIIAAAEELERKRKQIETNNYISTSTVSATERLAKLEQEMKTNREDPTGFADDFTDRVDEIHKEFIDNAPSDEAAQKLQGLFTNIRNRKFLQAYDFETKSVGDKAVSNAQENIQVLANSLFENPDNLEESLGQIDLVIAGTSGIFTKDQIEGFKKKAAGDISRAYIEGLLNAGKEEEARAILGSGKLNGILTVAQEKSLLRAADQSEDRRIRETQKESLQAEKELTDQRRLQIFNGEITQADLQSDLDAGSYGAGKFLSLSKELEATNKVKNRIAESVSFTQSRMDANIPFDTSDSTTRKHLDAYYESVISPMSTPDTFETNLAGFIEETGYLPKKVKSNLVAGLHNGTAEAAVKSAAVIDRIVREEPSIASQFRTTKDLGRARVINNFVSAGMPSEDAVKAADNRIKFKGDPEYEARLVAFKEQSKDFDQDEIESLFVNDPNEVPTGMKSDWESLYQSFVTDQGMSMEDAEDLAYRVLQSKWAITDINGEPEYMKGSPELYYNKRGLDPIWIKEQLIEDVEPILGDNQDYRITSNPATINSPAPNYYIMYENDNGVPLFLRDEDGDILTWKPDINTSENAAEQQRSARVDAEIKRLKKGTEKPETFEEMKALSDSIKEIREGKDATE